MIIVIDISNRMIIAIERPQSMGACDDLRCGHCITNINHYYHSIHRHSITNINHYYHSNQRPQSMGACDDLRCGHCGQIITTDCYYRLLQTITTDYYYRLLLRDLKVWAHAMVSAAGIADVFRHGRLQCMHYMFC